MNRQGRLRFETLESRLALSVTVDEPFKHEVPDNEWTGVLLNRHVQGQINGSVLLPTGRHVLTAGHTSEDREIVLYPGTVNEEIVEVIAVHPHPLHIYNPEGSGYDIAILELAHELDLAVQRYGVYREFDELGQTHHRVGFGLSGQEFLQAGTAGVKRSGVNRYDSLEDQNTRLNYDFDASGPEGDDEVLSAGGDSGSPVFIYDGSTPLIAGIANEGFNDFGVSAFGRGGKDARVSIFAEWIDEVLYGNHIAPTIVDVTLRGSSWDPDLEYKFSELVAAGEQFRSIATQNVTHLSIQFSEEVTLRNTAGVQVYMDASAMRLRRTFRVEDSEDPDYNKVVTRIVEPVTFPFSYDPHTKTATWRFNPLPDGKYSIEIDAPSPEKAGVVDAANNPLDGEWTNDHAGTPDNFADDPHRTFQTGNGTPGGTGSAFRLHFALLAGDYNGDGVVDAADASAPGDGNGDGVVDGSDSPTNLGVMGNVLALLKYNGADFNDDEKVDAADLQIWRTAYATNGNADADGDSDTDGNDFLVWMSNLGYDSVWSYNANVAAAVTMGVGPRVTNIIVSGSQSTHAPFSFTTVDGSGEQLKTVPVGGADTVTIVFDEAVNVSAGSLFMVGLQTINVPTLAEFSYDALTFSATWRFEGWAIGDQYLLALSDEVTNVDGVPLDGEWTNPNRLYQTGSSGSYFADTAISEFPSGDGTPGGWFTFVMSLLPGDADLNGVVNGTDFNILAVHYGVGLNKLFHQADFDGNGVVNGDDYDLLAANYNRNLQVLWVAADLNLDGTVDGADLAIIGDNAGMTGADWEDGDLDGDGEVTLADLDLALTLYGLWGLDGFEFNVVS